MHGTETRTSNSRSVPYGCSIPTSPTEQYSTVHARSGLRSSLRRSQKRLGTISNVVQDTRRRVTDAFRSAWKSVGLIHRSHQRTLLWSLWSLLHQRVLWFERTLQYTILDSGITTEISRSLIPLLSDGISATPS